MKVLKAFIIPFEAPQRSVKIKLIFILIQIPQMHGHEGLKFTLTLQFSLTSTHSLNCALPSKFSLFTKFVKITAYK